MNGDFTNVTGSLGILQGGEISMVGSASTTMNGSTDFNALTVQKTTGTLDVTLNTGTYTIAQFLRLAQGDLITGGNPPPDSFEPDFFVSAVVYTNQTPSSGFTQKVVYNK